MMLFNDNEVKDDEYKVLDEDKRMKKIFWKAGVVESLS